MSAEHARTAGRVLQGLGLGVGLIFGVFQWLISAGGLEVFLYQGF